MKVSDVWKTSGEYGSEASKVARSLAFSGFAVIWVFKTDSAQGPRIGAGFYAPAYMFASALACDLLEYVLGRAALAWFARYKEVFAKVRSDQEFDYPVFLLWPAKLCWWAKITLLLYGYYLLIVLLASLAQSH